MAFLPISRKEMDSLGWDYVDVIIVSGDAYVDHPSFGHAVIARVLESEGLRVAILPNRIGKMIYAISKNWGNRVFSLASHQAALIPLSATTRQTKGCAATMLTLRAAKRGSAPTAPQLFIQKS